MAETGWERVWDLFHRARELPPSEREAFVREAAATDPSLGQDVAELLAEEAQPISALDVGPLESDSAIQLAYRPGDVVGPYRLVRLLGSGGAGVVFEAEQQRPLERVVALKLIRPLLDTEEIIARFRHESKALARLSHPNVAKIFDAGATERGVPYMAMELIEGQPITDFCDARRFDVPTRLRLFLQVCDGVEHAHRRGLIHRDLKPSNILAADLSGRGLPKIIDFGIARAVEVDGDEQAFQTRLSLLIGTPEYMSPEQATFGAAIDTRTDVYALGTLLYELLTGGRPFGDSGRQVDVAALLESIRQHEPPAPSRSLTATGRPAATIAEHRATDVRSLAARLRGDLDWIVLRALEKDPERRYRSVADLAADIGNYLEHKPVLAGPPSRSYRFRKLVRRHRAAFVTTLSIAAVAALGAGLTIAGWLRAQRAEAEAEQRLAVSRAMTRFLAGTFRPLWDGDRSIDDITGREILTRGADQVPLSLGEHPEAQAAVLIDFGTMYRQAGLLEESAALMRQSVELRGEVLGPDHPQTLFSRLRLGQVLADLGRYDAAIAEYTAARVSEELADGDRRLIVRDMGKALQALGRHDEALPYLQEHRETIAATYGDESFQHGLALRSLASCQAKLGQVAAAEQSFGQSLERLEAAFGPDHPQVQFTLNNWAILHWELGEYEQARPLLQRALQIIERTRGPEHPQTASVMNNLGVLMIELREFEQARVLLERSYQVRRERLPADHPEIAVSLLNLGRVFAEIGERARASASFEQGLAHRERYLGAEDASLVRPLRRYADFLSTWGRNEDADRLRARAETIELKGA